MVKERKGNWKKDAFGFGIFGFKVPKRHISEQAQGPAQKLAWRAREFGIWSSGGQGQSQGPNQSWGVGELDQQVLNIKIKYTQGPNASDTTQDKGNGYKMKAGSVVLMLQGSKMRWS